jgi:beta,beta-carotene 9',10'-dioxygenase
LNVSDATSEDDGILVTVVFDGELKTSYIMLLDGRSFTVLNYAYLPYKVPFSFHGNWFPELY